ncbi:unnamed protein product [Closterium sp. NIES-53]
MLALCHEQRLEHRTRHIALRYFLAREVQQRGQLRLSYVFSWANTADVFTKALGSVLAAIPQLSLPAISLGQVLDTARLYKTLLVPIAGFRTAWGIKSQVFKGLPVTVISRSA